MQHDVRTLRPLVAAGAPAMIAAVAVPALTSAQSSTAREIVVREKVQTLKFVRQSRATSGDKRIGTLCTNCVSVSGPARVFAATLLCTASYPFADRQFDTVGAIRLGGKLGLSATPIVGPGSYRGQRGEVASTTPVKGYESADVLPIDAQG